MQLSSSIAIKAGLSKVFEVFTDLSKTPERISGIMSLEVLEGPEKLAMGTKWKETRKVFGKEETETMWVSEFTKNKHYSIDAQSHGTQYRSTISFKEVEGGTEVTWVFKGVPQTFAAKVMSLFAFLFARATRKLLEDDLRDLKRACES